MSFSVIPQVLEYSHACFLGPFNLTPFLQYLVYSVILNAIYIIRNPRSWFLVLISPPNSQPDIFTQMSHRHWNVTNPRPHWWLHTCMLQTLILPHLPYLCTQLLKSVTQETSWLSLSFLVWDFHQQCLFFYLKVYLKTVFLSPIHPDRSCPSLAALVWQPPTGWPIPHFPSSITHLSQQPERFF